MESHWTHHRPGYPCRHGHTSAIRPEPGRTRNAYLREDHVLPHLPALLVRLTGHVKRSKISDSAYASMADVGSSSTTTGALLMKARLRATFCP